MVAPPAYLCPARPRSGPPLTMRYAVGADPRTDPREQIAQAMSAAWVRQYGHLVGLPVELDARVPPGRASFRHRDHEPTLVDTLTGEILTADRARARGIDPEHQAAFSRALDRHVTAALRDALLDLPEHPRAQVTIRSVDD